MTIANDSIENVEECENDACEGCAWCDVEAFLCHVCNEVVEGDYFTDERANDAPENYGLILHEHCADELAMMDDREYLSIAQEGRCPECDRFNAHEGICRGPGGA